MRYIDAEKLFTEVGNIKPKNPQQYEDIGMFMNMITNTPTEEVQPVVGEWEEIQVCPAYDLDGIKTWASKMRCNKCGFTTWAIEGHFSQYNCCPNCGAKMD